MLKRSLTIAASLAVLAGCGTDTPANEDLPTSGTVTYAYSGGLEVDGRPINLPDVRMPQKGNQQNDCYYVESVQHLAELEGQQVILSYGDIPKDDLGHLWATVRKADGTSVNEELVADGYADAVSTDLQELERQARAANRGKWGACR